jgi:2-dehydro-3-deoxyphosphogluconate aldolase / (4S)-4-hydroxy-2-oxoglutarate aldolase
LKLSNVITVGGSWMLPKAKIEAGDWAGIEALAKAAALLK